MSPVHFLSIILLFGWYLTDLAFVSTIMTRVRGRLRWVRSCTIIIRVNVKTNYIQLNLYKFNFFKKGTTFIHVMDRQLVIDLL